MKIRPSGTTLLAALLLLTTGGTAGFLLRPADPPSDLASATELDSAPVVAEAFTDERNVRVALNVAPALDLVFGRSGTVTASSCVPGAALESGAVLARVDDAPVVGLATSLPLYRDLGQGHRGADVRALQKELDRLGYSTSVDGVYGWQTARAVRSLFKDAGVRHPDGRLSREDVVWMPSSEVAVDSCAVQPGSSVSAGGAYAEVPGVLESAQLESVPESPLTGDRLLTVAGVTGPVDEDGLVDDAEFLRELAGTPAVRSAQQGEEEPVNGSLELAEAVDAFTVPPGSLVGTAEGASCLESGGTLYAVRVVGSSLGGAVVVPAADGDLPDRVDLGPAQSATDCPGEGV
ncbi:peptidoglycan-binding domain-containing protein [Nocardiopsis sp. NPDC007018]|uniref:peptidoglycan-binding domain-containing protein n=1 Tax=Nocardiopsis sp. NPDC007018 TaxID=3155721 RepID=UPI0033C30BAB